MDYQSTQYTVDLLIQRIRTGRLALPDFQREFVWNPSKVVDLLDSVARRWPIGSLLLLGGPQPFAIRSIDHGPKIENTSLDLYILDGQQRITALFHAVSDVSDYCYYVDFSLLEIGDDDFIQWQRRDQFSKNYPSYEARAAAKIATIKEIWDLELFYAWLEKLSNSDQRASYVALRERRLGGLQAKVYKVMAVELDQEIELEALARIFETLNRTGVRLSAFDLMVAALYPSGFRLRDAWEEALFNNHELQVANTDSNEILKLISLIIRNTKGKTHSRGVRQGDLLGIDKSLIRDHWPYAVELYVKSLRYCKEHFGVVSEDVMPTPAMVLGVAILISVNGMSEYSIRRWWLNRLASQHYSQAANTRIISDCDAIKEGAIPIFSNSALMSSEMVEQPARRNGLLLRGLGALLIARGALDPISGQPLRESKKISFCAIDEFGSIRKMNTEDSLKSIVFTTEDSEIQLRKGKSVVDFPSTFWGHLSKQGIADKNGRSAEYIKAAFES
jgi:hypothetical protein